MERTLAHKILEIERRAAGVRISVSDICKRAGVRANNVSRWKSGMPPNMRTLQRDFPAFERAFAALERELVITLIERLNPEASASIIAMLFNSSNAGDPWPIWPWDEQRDSRESTGNAGCAASGRRMETAAAQVRSEAARSPDRAASS